MERNPVAAVEVIRPSMVDRKIFCTHYDTCLDEALENKWPNFSCRNCPVEKREKWTQEEAYVDALKCAVILSCINAE